MDYANLTAALPGDGSASIFPIELRGKLESNNAGILDILTVPYKYRGAALLYFTVSPS